MKLHHASQTIFAFLGLLVVTFGFTLSFTQYQSTFVFDEVASVENTQAYNEGVSLVNPFSNKIASAESGYDMSQWKKFQSDTLSFLYPGLYQLRIFNASYVKVTAPHVLDKEVCQDIADEQGRAECRNPSLSPHITIRLADSGQSPLDSQKIVVNNMSWNRSSYQDEYGGTTTFSREINNQWLSISFEHTDVDGGVSFKSLNNDLGNQYQLPWRKQLELMTSIASTLEVK